MGKAQPALIQLAKKELVKRSHDIESIVNEYGDLVLTLCKRILVDEHLAQEATQDTFVKAYRILDKFRSDSSIKTWLYRIAYNTAIDYRRKMKRIMVNVDELSEQVPNIQPANAQLNLEEQEQKEWLQNGINHLSADQAALISLYYLEERNIKEVCEITGLSESNVKIKLFRTRKQLAEILIITKKK